RGHRREAAQGRGPSRGRRRARAVEEGRTGIARPRREVALQDDGEDASMTMDHTHEVATTRPPLHVPREVPDEKGDVTIRFLGAARTTTGSLHRLRLPGGDLLLECGMYQGHRAESERWNRELPVDPRRVRAVVLSHAHIDHSGALPNLVRMGFAGPIWCTDATADLLHVMLLDAAHIQEFDAERMNRKRPNQPPRLPLYTVADAERALRLLRGVPYGKDFEPMPGAVVRFVD